MVELVDTQDLESCEATRAGSIPVIRTINVHIYGYASHPCWYRENRQNYACFFIFRHILVNQSSN